MTITLDGKTHIKRYLAGFVPAISQSIAFGAGGKSESSSDTKLQFEVGRSDVTLVSYDFVNNLLIFKATVPEDFGGTVYEVAIYSLPANAAAGEFGSRILTTFDSATETWVDASSGTAATFDGTATRIGADSLKHTPALSTTKTDTQQAVNMDLSGYSAADQFVLAANAGNAFTSAAKVLFLTDVSNYYTVNFGALSSGYNIIAVNKSSATATGTPNWEDITEIRVATTSTSGGASSVNYDGLRVEDSDTLNTDYVMVSRELLTTPYAKVDGMTQEIEYSLAVNV